MKTLNKIILGAATLISLAGNVRGQEIDSIINESKKYPTTIHFMYEIMKGSNRNFNDTSKLNSIINNVYNQINRQSNYSKNEVLDILNKIDKEIKNQCLEYKKNKFDCDDLSLIYLAVGEKIGLSLYGVKAPGHFFVRYDQDGRHNTLDQKDPVNKGDFNWETTCGGIFYDINYMQDKKISKESIEKKIYMNNLTKQELIADAYHKKGDFLYFKKPMTPALENYSNAIKLDSSNPSHYLDRCISYLASWKFRRSFPDYKKYKEIKK